MYGAARDIICEIVLATTVVNAVRRDADWFKFETNAFEEQSLA